MSLKTQINTKFDYKEWDNLLMKIPHSTAFQMSCNYDPYKIAFGSIPLYVTVEDSTGKILGQLLAVQHFQNFTRESDSLIQSLTSKLNIGSIINWHYGPIVHDDERSEEIVKNILEALDKYCIENKVLLIKGSSPVDSKTQHRNCFTKYQFENISWETLITSLKPELNSIYDSLHNKTRYDVRKGEKANLVFETVSDRSVLDEWMEVKFFENKNKKELIKKYEKFNDLTWEILYKPEYEKMFVARLDEQLISGIANKLFNYNTILNIKNEHFAGIKNHQYKIWSLIQFNSWYEENY